MSSSLRVNTRCAEADCESRLIFTAEKDAIKHGWTYDAKRGWLCPTHNIEHDTQTPLPFALETVRKDKDGFTLANYFGSSSQNSGFPEPDINDVDKTFWLRNHDG